MTLYSKILPSGGKADMMLTDPSVHELVYSTPWSTDYICMYVMTQSPHYACVHPLGAANMHRFCCSPPPSPENLGIISTGYIIQWFSDSHITLRWPISMHVQKVIPFHSNDPVRHFSQTGYQTEGISL